MKSEINANFSDEERSLITDFINKLIELTQSNRLIWIDSEHRNSSFCNFNGHRLQVWYPEPDYDCVSLFPSSKCPRLIIDDAKGFLSVYPLKGIRNDLGNPNSVTVSINKDYNFYELLNAISKQLSEYERQKKIRDEYWEIGNSQFKYLEDDKTFSESIRDIMKQ